ncbi:MAG: hypothetical protein IKF99_11890 [Oscillospiraceae bacterium]|nr:hypothetical protein [Oscillospiraceae bacterium]
MADWRNDPATEKQLAYIQEMQEFSDFPIPQFTGDTKGEASDYIDRWSGTAHESADFLGHADNYGDRI